MIKRTVLPNLHSKSNKKTSLSNNPRPSQNYGSGLSSLHQSPHYHFNKTHSEDKQNFSSLNNIEIKKKLYKLKTDQFLQSEMSTLEMKSINPEVFHTKVNEYKKQSQEGYYDSISQNQSWKIAPYFFKVQGGLKILQNQDELRRKMLQAQIEQAFKLKSQQVKNSKKRIEKKLTNSSSKKLQTSIDISQKNTARFSTITSTKKAESKKKFYTEVSQQNTQSLLQDRKRQLTLKGKQGKYTFEHFNSGQIFESIAELNEKKILSNPDSNQYRVTAYGTYVNNISGTKPLNRKIVQNRIYQEFKQEYNSFLKNKLPPSFGQNGNKSCIYEEYVEKRKLQSLQKIESKVVTRSEPKPSHKSESIFSNQINAICQRKAQAQKMYYSAVRTQEEQVIKKTTVGFLKQSSTQTSRMISQVNSKLNTLRHGQSFQDKLKLKKLAKLDFMEKAKNMKKNVLKSIAQKKEKQSLSKRESSLSGYSSSKDNKISQEQMQRLKEKSELILGKQFELSNPVVNPEQHDRKCGKMMKKVEKFAQLNEYEAKHLEHIDSLLKKEVSMLRRGKQELDSTPWKIVIKINKKPSVN